MNIFVVLNILLLAYKRRIHYEVNHHDTVIIPSVKASAAFWVDLIELAFGLLYRCGGSVRIDILTFPTYELVNFLFLFHEIIALKLQ